MVIARAALTLFTAWAFIHVALLTPGLAQSSSDGVVSRGYVVPGPRGQGNAIVSVPQTMSPNVSSSGSPNVNIYVDSSGAYANRYGQQGSTTQQGSAGQQGGNGGVRVVPLVPGVLPRAQ